MQSQVGMRLQAMYREKRKGWASVVRRGLLLLVLVSYIDRE